MTLAAIRDQIANRLADVIGARSKYPALPEGLPEPVPAVITNWQTRPVRARYGVAPAMRNREHTITAVCILTQRAMLHDEDAAGTRMAEAILESFEDNGRLDGWATSCDLQMIEPFVLELGSVQNIVAYYALRCVFIVKETSV
jgi:hypothetical protein